MFKINFRCHFFFKIMQWHCKLDILRILGMLDHPHEKSYCLFVVNFHAYLHAKRNFITHFFLKILQRNHELVILGKLGMSGHKKTKMIVSLWRNLWCLSASKKSTSSFMFFFFFVEILQRYCKLVILGTLSMPGYHIQRDYINL